VGDPNQQGVLLQEVMVRSNLSAVSLGCMASGCNCTPIVVRVSLIVHLTVCKYSPHVSNKEPDTGVVARLESLSHCVKVCTGYRRRALSNRTSVHEVGILQPLVLQICIQSYISMELTLLPKNHKSGCVLWFDTTVAFTQLPTLPPKCVQNVIDLSLVNAQPQVITTAFACV